MHRKLISIIKHTLIRGFVILFPPRDRNVIIFRLDSIGDFIIFSTALREIREALKDHHITLVVKPNNANLAEICPHVDRVLIFELNRYYREKKYRKTFHWKLLTSRAATLINAVYTAHRIDEKLISQFAFWINAKRRIAHRCLDPDFPKRSETVYTNLINSCEDLKFERDRNHDLAIYLGFSGTPYDRSEIWITEEDQQFADDLLRKIGCLDRRFAVLFPGAQAEIRIWSLQKYAELADKVRKELDLEVVFCCSEKEVELVDQIQNQMSERSFSLAGQTTLRQLAAVLKRTAIYVGNETSAVHIAVSLQIPTVCIIGGGHFGRFFPYPNAENAIAVTNRLPCFNCNWNCHLDEIECITKVSVDQVWKAISQLIQK